MDLEKLQSMVMNGRIKKFVSIEEGAQLYSIGKNTFREMAKDAQAMYRIKRRVLVNLEKMDEYMELFQDDN
ncbi:MAG: hypothetical protein J5825_02025 [Lachnospiraceae bacterium]|nr:hypothetical protein [Lachnospiraceae bacterium]